MKTTMISAACAIAAALALMPAGASAQGTDTTRSSTRDSSSMTRPTTASTNQNRISGAISDSAIIAMLQLSDTEEIAAADLAMTKASSDRVKRFAEELKTDHSKALQELQAYAQRMSNGGSSGMASGMAGSQSRRDSTSIASPMHHDSAMVAMDHDSAMVVMDHDSAMVAMDHDSAMGAMHHDSAMSAMHRDSAMTGRDNSAMAGQRDSSNSKMVQNDLPPGTDTVKSRTYNDSTSMSSDSNTMNRESVVTGQPVMSGQETNPSMANIESLSGHEFDHGFVRLQVENHQEEINHLRNDIIPMIKDSGLRHMVQGQLPVLGKHLREAQDLEAYLKTVD